MQKICFRSQLKITIVATLFAILSACGGGDSVEELPDPSTAGILLEGDVNAMASAAIRDYDAGDRTTPDEISVDSDGIKIDRTNISIAFVDTATVGDINAFLDNIDAKIVSMIEGVNIVLVKIPDPQNLSTLDTLIQQIESNPLIRRATKADMGGEDSLPGNYDAESSDLTTIDHNIAVLAPAAWNAKAALLHPGASAPLFLQYDYFGDGVPNFFANTVDINVLSPTDFSVVADFDEHGYHVLGIVSGRHNELPGQVFDDELVTGIYPGTIDVRIVDGMVLNARMSENKLVNIIRNSARKIVLNTSLYAGCERSISGDTEQPCIESKTRDWLEKVRGSTLYNLGLKNPITENSYLHITSAGNFRDSPELDNKLAELNSQYSAAKLLSGITTGFGVVIPNTSNTLVVENRMNTADSFYAPSCLSSSSKKSGDISAIGSSVWSFTDAAIRAGDLTGTSMSSPQVAGLAAYVWALNPQLSPESVVTILQKTARSLDEDESCVDVPAPVIDAYAAVLAAIDTPDNATSAPVRFAILDIADSDRMLEPDMVFDENDIARYIAEFDNRDGQKRDFSRFDLNGDGYTGGTRKARFNLDMDSGQFYTNVVQSLPEAATGAVASNLSFDEDNLTDLDILCYYGFSSLFTGDTVERDADLIDECVPNKVLFTQRVVDFSSSSRENIMSMNPDGSDQTRLTSDSTPYVYETHPALSPDGTKIVFLRNTNIISVYDANKGVFIMDVDGSNLTNLTNNPDVHYANPSWSPDGRKILFERKNQRTGEGDILTMDVDGSNLRNLSNSNTRDRLPSWSPDGTTIVFKNGSEALYSMAPNGTQQEAIVSDFSHISGIEWSPDSTQILFDGGVSSFQIIDADGSNRRTLHSRASGAKWSPDGTKIVFHTYLDQGQPDISIINSDGSNVISLTNSPVITDYLPIWSSDGKRIFFMRKTSKMDVTAAIYSIDPDGSNLQNLTNDPVHSYTFRGQGF